MTHADDTTDPSLVNGGRRKILTAALFGLPVAAVAGSLLYGSSAAHAATSGVTVPGNFADVSSTLTGFKPVDSEQAHRAWSGLVQKIQDFPAQFDRLAGALASGGITSYQQLPAPSIDADAALKATAMAIIAAWYLGRVGDVVARADVGPAFVSYTGALMWRPTLDATVIPTYATGQPGHWASKPVSLATD